ncbi:MAG: sugar ABC transporter substrate-binding protein, partial [Methylobacteriaceae bacterium]|nr:sugar ABC transporter substrate-binding protein [Methylobacteriaceae bacterium]
VRRQRTRTGKSFSIHPSQRLIDELHTYVLQIKHLVGTTIGLKEKSGDFDKFYFGASYLAGSIIPAPAVLPGGIGVRRKLRMLTFADPTSRAMQSALRDIEQTLGAEVQITALNLDALFAETLANASKPRSDYDILTLDLPWIAEFAERGFLMPLDSLLELDHFNKDDFHPAGWAAARYHGVQYGIPIQTTPELLMYRTDLFGEAGLDPPLTTEQVLHAARRFHRPSSGRYGIAWNGQRGTPIGQTFVQVLAEFGRPPLALRAVGESFDTTSVSPDEMRPTIDTPEGLLTAEYLCDLLTVSCPGVLDMAWDERVQVYRRGEVAMVYEWSIRAGVFEMEPTSPAKNRTGYLPLPRGPGLPRHVSPIGGLILSIPANIAPERVEASWRSIEWLTSPEMMKLFIQHGSTVSPRFSVSADPEVRAMCPVIALVDQMEKLGQLQHWPRPPVPAYAHWLMILGEEVHDLMLGEIAPRTMLRQAQGRIDAVMRERGYY